MKRNYLNLVSVREKCLNHSRPNGVSVVGINKAILTGKPAPTRPIVKTRSLEQIGKLSSMILRVGTTPKSSSIGGRKISPQKLFKSITDTKALVVPTSRRGYIKQDICVLPFTNYLLGLAVPRGIIL